MSTKGKSNSASSQHDGENPAARKSPSSLLTVSGEDQSRQSPRLNPPGNPPAEFELKIDTQLGRAELHDEAIATLPADESTCNLAELDAQIEFMEQLHAEFRQEHQDLEMHFAVHLLNHPYARDRLYMKTCRQYSLFRRNALKIRSTLAPVATARSGDRSPIGARSQGHLPDIPLPKFSGDYAQWPTFRDSFVSLITKNTRLTDVARLHYLRGCLEGTPAELIGSLELTDASFGTAWEVLSTTYENKRLQIQSQLNSIYSMGSVTTRSAEGLKTLVATLTKTTGALRSLGVDITTGGGGVLLVYHVSKLLDRATQEAWDHEMKASREFPAFDELKDFLTSHSDTLAWVETNRSCPPPPKEKGQHHTNRKSATAHQASAQLSAQPTIAQLGNTSSATKPFPCDHCGGPHYIVACIKFRALQVAQRRQVVVEKKLCFNCLGRHSVRACRSKLGCRECGAKHHTMLHNEAAPSSAPAQATAQPGSSMVQ